MIIIAEDFKIDAKEFIYDIPEEFIKVTFNIDSFEPTKIYMDSDKAKSLIESLSSVVF